MSPFYPIRRSALAVLFLLSASSKLWAVPMFATDGTTLFRFDTATPGTVSTSPITGMAAGDSLIGLGIRPSGGQLYGVGKNGHLYAVSGSTGAASFVFYSFVTFFPSGGAFGSAVNPAEDSLRLISNTHQNLRLNLANGDLLATDTPLSPPAGVNVCALAYSNNYPGSNYSTAYAIDSQGARLLRLGSVNGQPSGAETGSVTIIGPLNIGGTGLNQNIGFAIAPTGFAYAAINFGGGLKLYSVNLSTGSASLVGNVGVSSATSFKGMAALTGPQSFANNTTILIPDPNLQEENIMHASPYPSQITVSGMVGVVTRLRLQINDFRHRQPGDVDMLLVSPDGTRKMIVWSDVGGENQEAVFTTCGNLCDNKDKEGSLGVSILLADGAAALMPYDVKLASGFFKPTNQSSTDFFIGIPDPYSNPAPVGSATFASTFNGASPNGTWSLYIHDDFNLTLSPAEDYSGRIKSGWTLEISSGPACTLTCPANVTIANTPGQCGAAVSYPGVSPAGACGVIGYSMASGSTFPVGTTTVNVNTEYGTKCSFNVTVNDTQGPTISCNANIIKQADPGQTTTVVTFPNPTANDNCVGLMTSYSPPSGSVFNVGNTIVTGTATDMSGNTISCTFTVTVTPNDSPVPTAQLANISTRLRVESGDNVLIGGFIVTGNEPKKLIIRAIGPSLQFADKLANPQLQLFKSSSVQIAQNDNWGDAANKQEIIDSTVAPSDPLESAILGTFNPGAYTAVVSGVGGTGVGLVELYDLSLNSNSRLANISTRGLVQNGDNVLIAGTIVVGQASQKVIVRGIGPSLPVPGKLANPILELRDGNGGLLESNDDWVNSPNKQAILDSTIPPSNDLESAIVRLLPPASYTAILSGVGGAGVGVVEVYALN